MRLRSDGFTLIEVMVVIVVITLMAALVSPSVLGKLGTAKEASARTQIEMLGAALDAYRLDNNRYPSTEEGLAALWTPPESVAEQHRWRGPYLRKRVPPDPLSREYIYRFPGERTPAEFDLLSYGADGQPGGEREDADILSWE